MATSHKKETNVVYTENSLLIWLNNSFDEATDEFKDAHMQLRSVMNTIKKFNAEDDCVEFIGKQARETLNIVVSYSFGSTLIPRIHKLSQVNAIFIFDNHIHNFEEDWMRQWPKIHGLFTSVTHLCRVLQETKKVNETNSVPFSVIKTKDRDMQNPDQLEPLFMYTQLIKEKIVSIKFDKTHINQYLDHCRELFADNETELRNIMDMKENYRKKSAIWWYTKDSFLYPMLNRALRLTDIETILRMAFFIKDLDQELGRLFCAEFPRARNVESFTVYRGLCVSEEEMENVRNGEGCLIAFNSFLSTSKQREVSIGFVRSSLQKNPTHFGILYVMNINPSKATTSFASIEALSAIESEDEVLFSTNSVFRIVEVKTIDGHEKVLQVNLTLTANDDKDLCLLLNSMQQQNYPLSKPWLGLGSILKAMGHLEKAKEIFQMLINQDSGAEDKSNAYFELAGVHTLAGEHKLALAFYAKYLLCLTHRTNIDEMRKAPAYHNIGIIYFDLGNYSKALEYYKKALVIREKMYPSGHTSIIDSYNSLAGLYEKMNDQANFREYSVKALKQAEQSLVSTDPTVGKLHSNKGLQHYHVGEFSKALECFEKALEIFKRSLTPIHPDLAMCYNNIAGVYQMMSKYPNALEYMRKAHDIRKQSLPSNHPDMAMSYNNIGFIQEKIGDCPGAYSNYKIAIAIARASLSSDHPLMQTLTENLRRVNALRGS